MYTNIFKQSGDLINQSDVAYVSSIDENGYPHVATRSMIKSYGLQGTYFSTGTEGNLADNIRRNNKMSLCFHNKGDNMTLVGTAEIIRDQGKKKEMWLDWFIDHFPGGPTDPGFCLIKFTTEYVSLWVDHKSYKFSMDEVSEVTSMCGLMCQNCEWKDSHNCGGCKASSGTPFYGECHIAKCAIAKKLDHCGQCEEMPCQALKDYSCGEGEHCDNPKGARLSVLKYWDRAGEF